MHELEETLDVLNQLLNLAKDAFGFKKGELFPQGLLAMGELPEFADDELEH